MRRERYRPAIEGLTDPELKDFQVDFEAIAAVVPEEIQINGEMIASRTALGQALGPEDRVMVIQALSGG